MTDANLQFRTITPFSSPLSVQLGTDQFAPGFIASLRALEDLMPPTESGSEPQISLQGKFCHLGGQQNETRQYGSTESDTKDIRLMCWQPIDEPNVMFHVFTNNIVIAELNFHIDSQTYVDQQEGWLVKSIEQDAQDHAKKIIRNHYNDFFADLNQLAKHLPKSISIDPSHVLPDISWTSRTLVVTDEFLAKEQHQTLLTKWLAKTMRPEDATDIINGDKQFSMTWLNYAIMTPEPVGQDSHIHTMVLCQYYYVSQEHCNNELRSAIELAYSPNKDNHIDKLLAKTRTACRLNQIAYYENIKFLARPNRVLLEEILGGWNYQQLVENSERMIQVCDARIQEEDNKKRERSTIMTDFLLVALSFFAVFELSLYLTEFSREMMSRPALDYNDSKSSFFLSVIAEIDADIMFSFGFGLTLLLIIVYRYIKRH